MRDDKRRRNREYQRRRRQTQPWVQWYRTPEWRAYRKVFLEEHPACLRCDAPSDVVDHVRPHRGERAVFWDPRNHQPLCKACHDRKTSTEDGGFGRKGRPALGYSPGAGTDGFPSDPDHPWNKLTQT